MLPWTLKNVWFVGNPVAPFYNRVFPNPHVTIQWEDAYVEWAKHYSHDPRARSRELAEAPLELTVDGGKLGGMLGPAFLLAPLGLLAWRLPVGKALLTAALVSALPWWANAGTRFLIPALVFISLAMGMALGMLPGRWRYSRWLSCSRGTQSRRLAQSAASLAFGSGLETGRNTVGRGAALGTRA